MSNTGGRGFDNYGGGASSKVHHEKKDYGAEEKLILYWTQICSTYDYFDVSAAQLKLEIKKLHYLPFFRDTQKLNEIISTVVSCYKHSHGIHSYWDLNRTVLNHINNFQQRGPSAAKGANTTQPCHLTFEDVGIGSLASQRDVANLFKFSIPCDPHQIIEIKTEDIMAAAFDCLSLTKFRRGDHADESDFNVTLKKKLATYYNCDQSAIGLNVQYRVFFFANKSMHDPIGRRFQMDLHACEMRCKETKILEYSKGLAESMSILRTGPGPHIESSESNAILMRKISGDLSVDLEAAQVALKTLLIEAGPDNSFGTLFWALQKLQGKMAALEKMPSNSRSDDVELVCIGDVTKLMKNMQIAKEVFIMCEEKQNGILTSLAVAFICYLSLSMPKSGTNKKEHKKTDASNPSRETPDIQTAISEEIYRILKEKCIEDVPDFALNSLEHFITEIVCGADFDPVNPTTLKLNFISLQKTVRKELEVSWKKGGYTVKKNTHIGVLTASIIMYRMLIAEPSVKFKGTEGRDAPQVAMSKILNTIAATAMLETECRVSEADPVSIVVKVLSTLEVDIMRELNIPAVGCLQKGTFLHQLLCEHSELLKGLSEGMVRESKWGSSEVNGHQPEVRIADEDVAINLASCMKELAEHLASSCLSNNSESFFTLLLELEGAALKRIGSLSFQGATGKSLPEFIAFLVRERDTYDELHPMAAVIADFGIAYDSLFASFPALNSNGYELSLQQVEASGSVFDFSSLPCSISLQSALGAYLQAENECTDGLQGYLATSLAIFLSEKECSLLYQRHTSSDTPELSSLLGFIPPINTGQWSRPVHADSRSTILQRLKAVPYGFSCVSWCLWKSFETSFEGSLLDFIATEEIAITALRPNVRYLAQGHGTTADCIPVPCGITDSSIIEDAIRICFKSKDYCGLGAWCLAAELGYIDSLLFKDAVERSMAAELSNHHGLDNLVRISVETATSVPSSSLPSVFLTLLDVLAGVSETDLKYLQRKVFEAYYYQGVSNTSRNTILTLVSGLHHIEECNDLITFILNVSDIESLNGQTVSSKSLTTSSMSNAQDGAVARVDESCLVDASAVVSLSKERSRSGPVGVEVIDNCRIFVQNLLKSDFNYDSNGCKMEDRPVDIKLNKTIENLSNQLYSTEVHFLSEVIQNADDNNYSEGVTPSLHVVLSNTEIVFHINEKGFTEKDIKSVCSVSESSKEVSRERRLLNNGVLAYESHLLTNLICKLKNSINSRIFTQPPSPSDPRTLTPPS
jgi:hypothetical protein